MCETVWIICWKDGCILHKVCLFTQCQQHLIFYPIDCNFNTNVLNSGRVVQNLVVWTLDIRTGITSLTFLEPVKSSMHRTCTYVMQPGINHSQPVNLSSLMLHSVGILALIPCVPGICITVLALLSSTIA